MIEISVPFGFNSEKEYSVFILFSVLLNIEYHLSFENRFDYLIRLGNNKFIRFSDSFFKHFPDEDYLKIINIPENIEYIDTFGLYEDKLPVIFGNSQISINPNEIFCGLDIFASSFFMLSRWEEFVIKERDLHGRFMAKNSLAYKEGFLDRPIVNEYAEFIRNALVSLGFDGEMKKRSHRIFLTHDIDHPLYCKDLSHPVRRPENDEYNTFSMLMDLSEKYNLRSYFLFMCADPSNKDEGYPIDNDFIKKTVEKILERGHKIGFHPSYYSFNDHVLWKKEFDMFKKHFVSTPSMVRQHYLRTDPEITLNILRKNGILLDSSLSFADTLGFRSGICCEFPFFNLKKRITSSVSELPLTIMDATLVSLYDAQEEIIKQAKQIINTVKEFSGDIVILWHNSNFTGKYDKYSDVYTKMLDLIV